ncbi:IS256 family transposase IS1554 [Austwickia sp. TVS 96-490-7B]|nr:IS256 family transposase IS1554 [Austwickia sp. TVS 96-490-7B]
MLTKLRNRGVQDVFFVVCDGLKGLPASVNTVFPLATVQTCIIHLIRNTFRYASRKYWDAMSKDMKPIYTAPTTAAARDQFEELTEKWGKPYPAIMRLWQNTRSGVIPILDYDLEIRKVIC